jgi:hypothetical protein
VGAAPALAAQVAAAGADERKGEGSGWKWELVPSSLGSCAEATAAAAAAGGGGGGGGEAGSALESSLNADENWSSELPSHDDHLQQQQQQQGLGQRDRQQQRRRRRRLWERSRIGAPEVAAAREAKKATAAVKRALAGAFATIRTAVGNASAAPCAALLSCLEPEWAGVLVASVPLSEDDQEKRSEQRSAVAAATTGLHEALASARTGVLLGGLSDGAASYTISRVWETLLETLEYSLYNGEPHTRGGLRGMRAPPRGLPPSQLSAAVTRAGEVVSAVASATGDGGVAVAAATEKLVRLCEMAGESTPALLDRYTAGSDAVLASRRRRQQQGGSGTGGQHEAVVLQVQVRHRFQCVFLVVPVVSPRGACKDTQVVPVPLSHTLHQPSTLYTPTQCSVWYAPCCKIIYGYMDVSLSLSLCLRLCLCLCVFST